MPDMNRGMGIWNATGVMLQRFWSAYADEEMDDFINFLESQVALGYEGFSSILALAREVRATPWHEVELPIEEENMR